MNRGKRAASSNSNTNFQREVHREVQRRARARGVAERTAIEDMMDEPASVRRSRALAELLRRQPPQAPRLNPLDRVEIATRVAKHLNTPFDLARFGAVSRATRQAARDVDAERRGAAPCILHDVKKPRIARSSRTAPYAGQTHAGPKPWGAKHALTLFYNRLPSRYAKVYDYGSLRQAVHRRFAEYPDGPFWDGSRTWRRFHLDYLHLRRAYHGVNMICPPSPHKTRLLHQLDAWITAVSAAMVRGRTHATAQHAFDAAMRDAEYWTLYIVAAAFGILRARPRR